MAFLRSLVLITLIASASAFAPRQVVTSGRTNTALLASSSSNNEDNAGKFAASVLAGAYLFANVVSIAPAVAASVWDDQDFAGSSQILAARSGGRAGGRAAPSSRSSSSYRAPAPQPTYSGPSTVVVAPPPMYYSPAPSFPGLGLGLGLSAIGAVGDGIREYRQENEIRDARNQVQEARVKQAELEARLRSLENSQQK